MLYENKTQVNQLTHPTRGQPLRRATGQYSVLGRHKSSFLVYIGPNVGTIAYSHIGPQAYFGAPNGQPHRHPDPNGPYQWSALVEGYKPVPGIGPSGGCLLVL